MGINTLISIGNSDNRLTQLDWSDFIKEMRGLLQIKWASDLQIHGEWFSLPDQPWQNANWCIEMLPPTWWRSAVDRARASAEHPHPEASASAVHMRDSGMNRARETLKGQVRRLCYRWRQDSFAWTTAPVELVETGWVQPADYPEMVAREAEARRLMTEQRVYLDDEDRQRIRETLARNRRDRDDEEAKYRLPTKEELQERFLLPKLTPGEAGDSTPNTPAPALTGEGNAAYDPALLFPAPEES